MVEQISGIKTAAKLKQRKYRDATGKFLLEGRKCIDEAIAAGIEIETIFTDEAAIKKIATTDTPPEMVAVARQKIWDKSVLASAKKVVLLENIKDLGNLGTILRTCAAFGVDAVVLYGDCADIYNPKCVRSSVGYLWTTPAFSLDDLTIFTPFERIATLPRAKTGLQKFDEPWLLMFGSEADGLSQELTDFATSEVKIETKIESLNLAVSVGIVLFTMGNSL